MATPNTETSVLYRPETRTADAELRALTDELNADPGQGATCVAGLDIDDDLSALFDRLAAEGPVRGEPFV